MTARPLSRAFAEILRVRRAQESAAEMAVGRAATELRALDHQRQSDLRRLQEDQDAWGAAIEAGFDPSVMAAWSDAVLKSEAQVQATRTAIARGKTLKAAAAEAWRAASAHSDVAAKLAERSARVERRRREEAVLNELTDRLARRGRS